MSRICAIVGTTAVAGLLLASPARATGRADARTTGRAEDSRQAPAAASQVAVVPVRGEAVVSDTGLADAMDQRIQDTLAGASIPHDVLGATTCATPQCLAAHASRTGARYVLTVRVRPSGPDQRVELRAVDLRDNRVIAEVGQVCELCGRDELVGLAGDLTAAFVRRLGTVSAATADFTVRSTPSGATVRIDGGIVGTTPFAGKVLAGDHTLTLDAGGHTSVSRNLVLVEGGAQHYELALPPVVRDDGRRRARWMTVGGATTLGLGVAASATGIALLSVHRDPIDNDCSGDSVDADGDCRWLRNTRGGGIGTLSGGAALMVAGAVILGVGLSRRGPQRARASVTPSGLRISGRF